MGRRCARSASSGNCAGVFTCQRRGIMGAPGVGWALPRTAWPADIDRDPRPAVCDALRLRNRRC
jgi:hypothetical protein